MKHALQAKALEIMEDCQDLAIATLRADGFPQVTTVSFVHDGLEIYVGTGADSQKARNIGRDSRVSISMTPPYTDWNQIRGLSMAGHASQMTTTEEINMVARLMVARFPQVTTMELPEFGQAVFFRITPTIVSVLDYSKGFGHADTAAVYDNDIAESLESMRHKWLLPVEQLA